MCKPNNIVIVRKYFLLRKFKIWNFVISTFHMGTILIFECKFGLVLLVKVRCLNYNRLFFNNYILLRLYLFRLFKFIFLDFYYFLLFFFFFFLCGELWQVKIIFTKDSILIKIFYQIFFPNSYVLCIPALTELYVSVGK